MKTVLLPYALITGILAVVVGLLAVVRSSLQVDSLVGYGVILMLVATAAVDYRINWKRIFGR
jgi:hypothetical protein